MSDAVRDVFVIGCCRTWFRNKLGLGTFAGVDYEKLLLPTPQYTIDFDFAGMNSQDCARASIHCFVFRSTPIGKNADDLAFGLRSNKRLHSS